MRASIMTGCVLSLLTGLATGAVAAPTVTARYAGPDGPWDYVSLDVPFQRLYVGRGDGVLMVDLATGVVTPQFVKGRYTAAVVPLPDGKTALTTARRDNLITFFDRATGKTVAEIATGKGPDAATLDPTNARVYVMNGDEGTISVVDSKARKIVRKITVGGSLEAAALDGKGYLFVNVEDKAEVAVVDLAAGKTVAHIALPQCEEPTGIEIDTRRGVAYSICGNGRLMVIDTARRAIVGSVPAIEECDGLMLDAARNRIYTSSGNGKLGIFSLVDPRKPKALAPMVTHLNARTGSIDARSGRVYVAGGPYDAKGAAVGHFEVLEIDAAR